MPDGKPSGHNHKFAAPDIAEPKTCPGAHFKYFAHCERCKWSEAIMLEIAEPWPKCEVCGELMAVYAIGKLLEAPQLKPRHEMQGAGFDPGAGGYELQGRQQKPGATQ